MKEEKINSVVYKTGFAKILVSIHYSEHKKKWYVQGSIYGKIETGGSSFTSTIKACIKNFIEKNKLQMNGNISHCIYGIYAVEVIS